jgi:transcriptional regulator with XRE-family HTH domain
MPEYSQRLADAIRNTRLELGLTQEEVAERSNTDVRTIINMEMGRGNPKLKTLYAVIRALKMDARIIFDDDPQIDRPTVRHLRMIFDECSEEEITTLLPVVEAVLTALRSNKGTKIQ